MAETNRLKKIGGVFKDNSFASVAKQIEGRGILCVVVINRTCTECEKIQLFINSLQLGAIQKLPNLVLFYGYSSIPLDQAEAAVAAAEKKKSRRGDEAKDEGTPQKLGDSSMLDWEAIPEGHGYALLTNSKDKIIFKGDFDHNAFQSTILDTIRRFHSSIRTLPNLEAKKHFIENKGTAIIVETNGATPQSKVHELEIEIAPYIKKIKIPIYFLRSISQEISYYNDGKLVEKVKGLHFDKLLKKLPGH